MNKIRIGVCLALLVPTMLLVTRVVPQAARAAELRKEVGRLSLSLEAARPGTPSREDIASWNRYRSDLFRASREIRSFYAERDRHFERWFPGLAIGPDGVPSRDAFVARHRDEARLLEEELDRAAVKVGPLDDDRAPGFNWERLTIPQLDDVGVTGEAALLRALQKRYYARRRIAEVALQGKVRVSRIMDFRFFHRLHDRITERSPAWSGAWPGLSRDFQEVDLPGGLGRTFTFGAVLQLPPGEVPRAIRELLNEGSDLLSLVGSSVTIGEPLTPIEIPYEKGKDQEFEQRFREAREAHPTRDVLLVLTCRILDVDLGGAK